jgi:hypothetical protein
MCLLDELDGEAAWLGAAADDAARRKADVERIFHERLVPEMENLRAFLDRLVANLKLLRPRIEMRYPVPGYGDIIALVEHDHAIEERRNPSSRTLVLSFSSAIASNECPQIEVRGAARVRSLAGVFNRHRIAGMSAPHKDASGDVVSAGFRARGRIASRASFHVDSESTQLRMSFENVDGLGTTMKAIPAERVNAALFDEIGRYLMAEPDALFREELPEAYRRQLRQKVQHEQLKRRWESSVSAPVEAQRAQRPAAGTRVGTGPRVDLRGRVANAGQALRRLFDAVASRGRSGRG